MTAGTTTSSRTDSAFLGLSDMVDRGALQRLCNTFARLHRVGLSVVDLRSGLFVDSDPERAPCLHLGPVKGKRCGCPGFEHLAHGEISPPEPGEPRVTTCLCGLENMLLGIRHQGRLLGYLVFGPFTTRSPEEVRERLVDVQHVLETPPEESDIVKALDALDHMIPMSRAWVHDVGVTLGDVLTVMVQNGYARLLTSQLHVAAIQDAYNELAEKNRSLADLVEKLKDLDRLKSNFMGTVSHELRTPLTSIIGYSEMLRDGDAGPLSDGQRSSIEVILTKAAQLQQTISEVLEMSLIETGALDLSCGGVDLAELLNEVTGAFTLRARSKDIRLTMELQEGLPGIWGDRAKIRQALNNLLSNAVKFTPAHGQVRVAAGLVPPEAGEGAPGVLIRVSDSGIGVPEADREQIFEAFFQVDSDATRVHGGTGLGLAIVKNFVEAHGGRVWVEPGEDGGSVFFVELPLRPPR